MSNLFLIYSPFQALCAFEAIAYYKISEYKLYCIRHINNNANRQTEAVLSRLYLDYSVIAEKTFAQSIVYALKHSEKYDRVFIGDFFDPGLRLYASVWCKLKAHIYYLDDGASTLTATSVDNPLSFAPGSVRIKYLITNNLFKAKRVSERYYSIFDLKANKGDKNTLSSVKDHFAQKGMQMQTGIYIIGTKYTGFQNPELYLDLLDRTISKFEQNTNTFYSPHRAVAIDPKVEEICKKRGVSYKVSEYCVELDYILNGANPEIIIGYGSTAMFSLKMIYPTARCITIRFPEAMLTAENATIYENVYKTMRDNGIEVITL